MFSIALAAAAQATAPAPVLTKDLRTIFRVDDYPSSALQRGEQGAVIPEILVNPNGHVELCTIAASSGYPDLDSTTCAIIRERTKFSPPIGPNGEPVYSLNRVPIGWGIGGPLQFAVNPDMELSINQAPAGVQLPVSVFIKFLRTPDGSVTSCRAAQAASPELVDLACRTTNQSDRRVIRNAAKQPVTAWDAAQVRFVLQKP
jgi:protein TonB